MPPGHRTFAEVSDSSGVSIVTISVSAIGEKALPHASRTPRTVIGADVNLDGHALHDVIGGLIVDDNVLALAVPSHVMTYDVEGKLLTRMGGTGSGPGEFRRMTALFRVGDSGLGVWDPGLQRATIFGVTGSVQYTVPLAIGLREAVVAGANGKGVIAIGAYPFARDLGEVAGVRRDFLRMILRRVGLDSDGTSTCELPGDESYYLPLDGVRSSLRVPFGSVTRVVSIPEGLAYSSDDGGEVRIVDDTCTLRRVVRIIAERIPVGEVAMKQVRDSLNAAAERLSSPTVKFLGDWMREAARQVPIAETYPLFEALLADWEGRLWIELTEWYRPPGQHAWLVLSRDGTVSTVLGPSIDVRILDVSMRGALGLSRSEFGVERVEFLEHPVVNIGVAHSSGLH
jgi:hypothetical protein